MAASSDRAINGQLVCRFARGHQLFPEVLKSICESWTMPCMGHDYVIILFTLQKTVGHVGQ